MAKQTESTIGYYMAGGMQHAIKATHSRVNPMSNWFFGQNKLGPDDFDANDEGLIRAYLASLWAYRCIKIRGMRLAAIPLEVRTLDDEYVNRDGKPVAERVGSYARQHILQRLIGERATRIWRTVEYDMGIWGRAFIEPTQKQLFRLNPTTVEVLKDPDEAIQGFRQTVSGRIVAEWEPDELVYLYDFDPADDFGSISPLAFALRAVGSEVNINDFVEAFFDNDATPAGILTTDQPIQDVDIDKAVKWWEKMFAGVRRRGTIGVVGGGLRFEPISSPLGDLAIPDLRLEVRREITAAFGVPMTIALADEAANFSTSHEQYTAFYTETILPELDLIIDTLNEQLVPRFGDNLKIVPDLSEVRALQEDKDAITNRATSAFQAGAMSINEARTLLQQPPLDDDYFIVPNLGLVLTQDLKRVARAQLKALEPQDDGTIEPDYGADAAETPPITNQSPTKPAVSPRVESNGNGSAPKEEKRPAPARTPIPSRPTGVPSDMSSQYQGGSFHARRTSAIDDLRRWRKKVRSRGGHVKFDSTRIPSSIKGFLRWDLRRAGKDRIAIDEAFITAIKQMQMTDPTPEEFDAYWRGLDDIAGDFIEELERLLSDPSLRNQVADTLEQTQDVEMALAIIQHNEDDWVNTLIGDEANPGPLAKIFLAGAARGNELYDVLHESNQPVPVRHYMKAYEPGLQVDTGWNLIHKDAIERAKEYAYNLVRGINETTTNNFRDAMQSWLEAGGGMSRLTDLIQGRLRGLDMPEGWTPKKMDWAVSRDRARQIAQTESTRVFTEGNVNRWEQLGVKQVKWRTQNDGKRVCPVCQAMNNSIGDTKNGFAVPDTPTGLSGWTASDYAKARKGYGAYISRPPAHPGCRCFVAPVTGRRDRPLEPIAAEPRLQGRPSANELVVGEARTGVE